MVTQSPQFLTTLEKCLVLVIVKTIGFIIVSRWRYSLSIRIKGLHKEYSQRPPNFPAFTVPATAHTVNSRNILSSCGTKSREDRSQGSRSIDIRILSSLIQGSDLFGRSPYTYWVVFVWHLVSYQARILRSRK
jgi:hypothetical protein